MGPTSAAACRSVQLSLIILGVGVYLIYLCDILWSASFREVVVTAGHEPLHFHSSHYSKTTCLRHKCVNKCCSDSQGFISSEHRTCTLRNTSAHFSTDGFVASVNSKFNRSKISFSNSSSDILFVYDQCGYDAWYKYKFSKTKYDLENNINLLLAPPVKSFEDVICLEFVDGSNELVVVRCQDEEYTEEKYSFTERCLFKIILASSIVSSLAILLILGVYSYIPKLRNLQGKILICYLISVLIFNCQYFCYELLPEDFKIVDILDVAGGYFVLGWLSWLTVMSYDIWSTFSGLLPDKGSNKTFSKKFYIYLSLGWGWPIIHVILLELAFDLPAAAKVDAMNTCMTVSILLNLLMFVSTFSNLRFQQFSPKDTRQSRRHGAYNRHTLVLYLKLALLMGLDWLFLVVSSLVGNYALGLIVSALLESQGVFLFVFLVYNKRVLRLLRQRWYSESITTEGTTCSR